MGGYAWGAGDGEHAGVDVVKREVRRECPARENTGGAAEERGKKFRRKPGPLGAGPGRGVLGVQAQGALQGIMHT